MEKRDFSYSAGALTSGYFVNFVFHAEPTVVDKLRAKFKLDPEVYRQNYQKLSGEKGCQKEPDPATFPTWRISTKSC